MAEVGRAVLAVCVLVVLSWTTPVGAAPASGAPSLAGAVVTVAEDPVEPDYGALTRYLPAAGAAVVIVAVAYLRTRDRPGLGSALPGIAEDWSFADSWASNVGAAAALFTGLFGAGDVLETILGDGEAALMAVAVVAAGISAALIGIGPLLITLLRTFDGYRHSVVGVLAGSAVVLTANLGLIWVLEAVLRSNEVVEPSWVTGLAVVATLLIVGYVMRSVPHTLTTGKGPGPGPGVSGLPKVSAMP